MPDEAVPSERRFAVAWRNVTSRTTSHIGTLSRSGDIHAFTYLERASAVDGFRPLLGFSNFNHTYTSLPLFPIFAQRVMDKRRPDFLSYVESLGLTSSADALDILGRSGGRRKADTLQLMEEPNVDVDGISRHVFFVQGLRHAQENLGRPVREVDALMVGQQLLVTEELSNEVNVRALQVQDDSGVRIGWIPELLLDHFHQLDDVQMRVLQLNGLDMPPYLRLLVAVTGRMTVPLDPTTCG